MRSTADIGSDTASYVYSTAGIIASLSYGVGAGGEAEGDTYASIENLIGSRFTRTRSPATTATTHWRERSGDDFLDGGDGNDTL